MRSVIQFSISVDPRSASLPSANSDLVRKPAEAFR